MRNLLMVLPFVAMTFLAWGNYGPLMHEGQYGMGGARWKPFICVGMAYFLIAVVVPLFVLNTKGESGKWTFGGTIWSLAAGAITTIGALGIIMAFNFRGNPVYVMPLVFGCAPVVNTIVSMAMARTFKEASAVFYLGVLIVALGAAGVMYFKPVATNISIVNLDDGGIKITKTNTTTGKQDVWTANSETDLETNENLEAAYKIYNKRKPLSPTEFFLVIASIATTALCWGSYGPLLHKGQMKMAGSRLRPFLCVGLAYFAIAVCAPGVILGVAPEPGSWTTSGVLWSLAAGAAGAIGSLGIILAFNFGGKPVFVMPLVFGGAPVVNTFTTVLVDGTLQFITVPFYVSLGLVIAGAVTVLTNAPKPAPKTIGKPAPAEASDDKPESEPEEVTAE